MTSASEESAAISSDSDESAEDSDISLYMDGEYESDDVDDVVVDNGTELVELQCDLINLKRYKTTQISSNRLNRRKASKHIADFNIKRADFYMTRLAKDKRTIEDAIQAVEDVEPYTEEVEQVRYSALDTMHIALEKVSDAYDKNVDAEEPIRELAAVLPLVESWKAFSALRTTGVVGNPDLDISNTLYVSMWRSKNLSRSRFIERRSARKNNENVEEVSAEFSIAERWEKKICEMKITLNTIYRIFIIKQMVT